MYFLPVQRIFQLSLLLLLITTMITSKSIDKRIATAENEVEGGKITDSTEKNIEDISEKPAEIVEKKVSFEDERKNVRINFENTTETNEIIATEKSNDNSRSQRTIAHLREVENPLTMIENFKNKLKTARNNIQEQLSRKSEPRIFIYDPKNQPNSKLLDPLKPNLKLPLLPRTVTQKPETDPKTDTVLPTAENSSSQSSEEIPPKEETKTLRNTEKSTKKESKEDEPSSDITHLLHVKEEIDKLRNIMQVLREQQLKQQFGSEFPHTKNLTTDVHKELTTFVDKMKNDGKISTASLPGEEHVRSHPPDTNKLMEDIKHLRESVLNFAHQVGMQKVHEGNFEKLVDQINQQKKEIEDLKKLVDELQPTKHLPAIVKNPNGVKKDLHQELRKLQEVLNELMKKEEQKVSVKQMMNPNQLRQNQIEAASKPFQKSDEDSEALMKILQTIAQPGTENKQSTALETKLEKLERDLKNLDLQNQRTRQELILDRLEKEISLLKSSKFSPSADEAIKPEKIKRTEALNGKISSLEKQMQQLPKQQSVQLDSDKIEKELEKLQREIDNLTKQTKGRQMTSEQIENVFNDTVSPQQSDSPFTSSLDKLKGIIKHPLTKVDSHPLIPVIKPDIPTKFTEVTVTKPEKSYPAVFQIPYCLQKNPHYHYPPPNVDYHPYPPISEVHPITVDTVEEHHPIKTIEHVIKPEPQPLEPIKFEKIPLQPIEHKEEHHEPIKIQVENKVYNKPDEINGNQNQGIDYNNEHDKIPTTDYNKEHIYQPEVPKISPISYHPTIPKATPVKIEYHSLPTKIETPNLYPYTPEQIQYKINEYKPSSFQSHAALEEQINHLNSMIGNLDEKINYSEDVQDFEYQPKNYKHATRQKRSLPEDNTDLYNNIQERLANLRQAVENIHENQNFGNISENDIDFDFGRAANSDYYQPYNIKDYHGLKKRQKFDDLFIKIVKFVLHKLEISAPFIVDSLFNGESYINDDNYKNSNKYYRDADEDSDLYKKAEERLDFGGFLNNFQGFNGLLGFIPTILIKLLSNFSSFLTILKRNNFFKNFLFPGGLILAVDGILAILIWWFSTDENLNVLSFQNNSNHEYVNQTY